MRFEQNPDMSRLSIETPRCADANVHRGVYYSAVHHTPPLSGGSCAEDEDVAGPARPLQRATCLPVFRGSLLWRWMDGLY